MSKLVCYTSPARGHLFPTLPVLLELQRRGHDVVVLTLKDEVARVAATGLKARPIAAAIEALPHDDHVATSTVGALDRAVRTFARRADHEIPDLQAAIAGERPDALLVDFNCWGASMVAEKSGLPWALFMPYFLPLRLPGLPPFGPGLAPASGLLGRLRDAVVGGVAHRLWNRHLPLLNGPRQQLGLAPLEHITALGRSAPRVLYYTAEPFEYPCAERPDSVVMVGPMGWEPPAPVPEWLARIDRPLVLVTCSTEYQADGKLIGAALEALAGEDVFVVATTAAIDPAAFTAPANARVERFLPHGPLLQRAAAVVCHGGMGITQKALAAGVSVCVVPFGRDQLEVATHVEVAGAGVKVAAAKLTPPRLRDAVAKARGMKAGAERIAAAFAKAGGAPRAASALEELMAASALRRSA